MKIVLAIDSFKGCMTSSEAENAAKQGILRALGEADVVTVPISDGGEGLTETFIDILGMAKVSVTVSDPLGRKINASYGYDASKKLAVMEMAAAAGLTLIDEQDRNPMNTSSYGVGEMIADAIHRGVREFIIGIGGSATNDGGTGMLQALGFEFLDSGGRMVKTCGAGLKEIRTIRTANAIKELAECRFSVLCDVNNPLCGDLGCSKVFGPQKGLGENAIELMDGWLWDYSELVREVFPETDKDFPGAGAAGGLGFAFKSFLNAELIPGMEKMMEISRLEEKIRSADLVVTGEGCLDSQSFMGKVTGAVAGAAKKYGKPVIAFAGMIKDEDMLLDKGIEAMFPIAGNPMSMEEAMKAENAKHNMELTAEQVFRVVGIKDT